MPPTLTYPGVYIQEVASGVRTIVGVATSIAAFIGRAKSGPVNKAVVINSFSDFERVFGGLWTESSLGFAVRDFYMNGGSQAVIVRLFRPDDKSRKATVSVGNIKLDAANEGKWGSNLRVRMDTDVSKDVADRFGLTTEDLFNLTVLDRGPGGIQERFLNLSFKDSPRRIDKVLETESRLVLWHGEWPTQLPKPVSICDDVTIAESNLKAAEDATPQEREAILAAKDELDKALMAIAASDGIPLTSDDFLPQGAEDMKQGLYALDQVDLFNLLCIPPYTAGDDVDIQLISQAAVYCEKRRAMLLVDPPADWIDKNVAKSKFSDSTKDYIGTRSKNAALFFPRLKQPNPLSGNRLEVFAPCGAVAGIFARTDMQRGVWKAPAGLDATLVGVPQLSVTLTDDENGELNLLGINCLRSFPVIGRTVWGARTLRGADQLADEWKYIPVRRTALYIEESLYRGLQWAVFEPNDEELWSQIRLNVNAFMLTLFRRGAFQGATPAQAYYVKCDHDTNQQEQIDRGIVTVQVGFAPLKPAEFVVVQISQKAGQAA